MAAGEREVSISDDGVLLEVYEIQDSAQQECMMLVQKLSETSLGANKRERSNLTEHLAEAQKEVANVKASLRTANDSIDDLTNQIQQEKGEKLKTQTLFENAISVGRKKDEKLSALEKGSCEQEQRLGDVKKQVIALETERDVLRKEVEGLRGQNEDADEQISILNSRLLKERQKFMVAMEESEEQMINLKNMLHDQRQKLEDTKSSSDAELVRLKKRLAHQQRLNESLTIEADENTTQMQRQVDELEQNNKELSKVKRSLSTSVETLQKEIIEMGSELDRVKERYTRISSEKERSAEELNCRLRQKETECESLAAAKEEAEKKQKQVQSAMEKLERSFKELQVPAEELLTSSAAKEPSKPISTQADGSQTADSEDPEPTNIQTENDWEQMYCQLRMENSNLHKQYLKLKKHRNQVLRENTNQKQQMQMAIAQLNSNNSRFHRQMEQLRVQLGMAEVFCQEKAQEAHTLELQLQQMLFQNQQFDTNQWSPGPVQRYWQQPTRYGDGNDGWRVDG